MQFGNILFRSNPISFLFPCVLFFDAIRFSLARLFGSFPSALLAILLWIPWLFHPRSNFIRAKLNSSKKFIIGSFLLFFTFALGSFLWTSNMEYGLEKVARLVFRSLGPCVLFTLIYNKRDEISHFPTLLFGLLYCGIIIFWGRQEYHLRFSIPDVNPIWAARVCLIFVTICLWSKRLQWLPRMTGVTMGILAALLTQSRGGFVAFAAANALILVLSVRLSRIFIYSLIVVMCSTFSLILLITLVDFGSIDAVKNTRFDIFFSYSALESDFNFNARTELLRQYGVRFFDHMFFGGGVGSVSQGNERDYPHNLPLELLCEYGMIGISIWFACVAIALRCSIGQPLIIGLIVQCIIYTLFSGDLGYNSEFWLLFFLPPFQPRRETSL